MTSTKKGNLEPILYIYYSIYFQKYDNNTKSLINFNSKINIITSTYTSKLGHSVCKTNIELKKLIDQA